jgi:prophage tail gpP-like protein
MITLVIDDRIRTRRLRLFNEFSLDLRYDSVASSFAFSAFFDPNNNELKEMMCIGHDHIARVYYNNQILLTGYILKQTFSRSANRKLVTFSGYSYPGFIEDCQNSPDTYPLQNDGLTLREIASKMIAPFKITMVVHPVVESLMNEPFSETTCEATETIKDYLTKLAAQKGIVITHNELGHLIFTKADTTRKAILHYGEGGVPITDIDTDFDGQVMHSHIYVVQQADDEGENAGQSTIRNPYVPFVYRPKVITQSSGTDVDTDKAARMALSQELKGLKLSFSTDKWDLGGKVITPNNIITVKYPEVYLFKKSRWFIESVSLTGNQNGATAKIGCALPEVYNDGPVEYMFKGINLH